MEAGPADRANGHLSCPFCQAYDVTRLFVASIDTDSCECAICGATWEERRTTGAYRGRAEPTSVLLRR